MAADERFRNRPYVTGPPRARFYAGVPIRTPAGMGIGAYCVLDDKPRSEGVTDDQLIVLKDIALSIMRHLELVKSEEFSQRMGRMVRGLGRFIEDPGRSTDHGRELSGTGGRRSWGEDVVPNRSETLMPEEPRSTNPSSSQHGSTSSLEADPVDGGERLCPGQDQVLRDSVRSMGSGSVGERTPSTSRHSLGDPSESVKCVFTRAAGIIKDAIGADGLVFYDANITTFGGLVEDREDTFVRDGTPSKRARTFTTRGEDKPCGVLGYLVNDLSGGIAPSECMPEKLLGNLLRRYPRGKIFEFGTTPQSTPSSDLSEQVSDADLDLHTLSRLIPKAKSLVLLPLYAFDTNRTAHPFAAALLWTCDRERVFREGQVLAYLKAFGNSMMAELARVDAQRADRAKADFISGVTHELRSPLHGILGCIELMLDDSTGSTSATLSKWHKEMAQTIETCSRTLLDTVNHVLDFAKINHVKRHSSPSFSTEGDPYLALRGPMTESSGCYSSSADKDVDLAALVEEVVETACAGHRFPPRISSSSTPEQTMMPSPKGLLPQDQHSSSLLRERDNLAGTLFPDDQQQGGLGPGAVGSAKPVLVFIDMRKTSSWTFRTQPGAWRRILMNLFGNALKYTDHGYISVRLESRAFTASGGLTSNKDGPEHCEVVLTVTDSGRGMSSAYLRDHLFHPFAQEDPLTPGTGLGLSITRQIVASMDGRIDVRSEKGRGTQMTVTIPVERVGAPEPAAPEVPRPLFEGKSVAFIGFSDSSAEHSTHTETLSSLVEATLKSICTTWWGMQILPPESKSDVYVVHEAAVDKLSLHADARLLIVGAAYSCSFDNARPISGRSRHHHINLPCGPKKLAAALLAILQDSSIRVSEELNANTVAVNTSGSNIDITEEMKRSIATIEIDARPGTPTDIESSVNSCTPEAPAKASDRPAMARNTTAFKVLPESSPSADTAKPLNVLLVDDNPVNLRVLNAYMKRRNHLYSMASNGLDAVNAFKEAPTPYDLILMDISMPIMDGLEATRVIRAHEMESTRDEHIAAVETVPLEIRKSEKPRRPTTIVALTGLSSHHVRQEALQQRHRQVYDQARQPGAALQHSGCGQGG